MDSYWVIQYVQYCEEVVLIGLIVSSIWSLQELGDRYDPQGILEFN